MRVAVVGGNGQLGSDVCEALQHGGYEVLSLTHAELDVLDPNLNGALAAFAPKTIVNTAALHHVEKCEANPAAAFAVNASGARNLATYCAAHDAALIHISTDYVFDGRKASPYVESDLPCPLNVYGNSKLAGEYFVRTIARRHFVLRVCGLYGRHPCRGKGGSNFVETMLRLAQEGKDIRVTDDERVTPTSTREVAQQIVRLMGTDAYGLYHGSAEGNCSWFDFADAIFSLAGVAARLARARPGEFPAKTPRPQYSVMENAALKAAGLNVFQHWREGLRRYLVERQIPQKVAVGC